VNTLRAYLGSDTLLTLWLRDEAGKRVFSSETCRMYLYPYGSGVKVEEAGIAGVIDAEPTGQAEFTVTEAYAEANLKPGPLRYVVKLDDVQVADGLLEVV
jgi:hypothetical protein